MENPQKMSHNETQRFSDGVKSIWADKTLTDEQRRIALSVLSSQFNKTAFINIVEEPEQNLFPVSQRKMLYYLLEFNCYSKENKLIITTHSPYIINDLSLAVKAKQVELKMADNKDAIKELERIVPIKNLLSSDDLVIYEIDDRGTISKLIDYRGLPSDENYLNELLAESGYLFTELLQLEDKYGQ